MRVTGARAQVVASNDETLRGSTIDWKGEGEGIPPGALRDLRLDFAVEQPFAAGGTQWRLVCGARGAGRFVLPDLLDDWALEVLRQLAECNSITSPSPEVPAESAPRIAPAARTQTANVLALCIQPIFSIALRRATRAELLVRSLAADGSMLHWPQFASLPANDAAAFEADQWALRQALEMAARLSHEHAIQKLHVNVRVYENAHLAVLLEMLSSVTPALRALTAFEIQPDGDFLSEAFAQMVRALNDAGCEVGAELTDCTFAQLARLSILPLSFVKIPAEHARGGWIDALPWDIFLTRVESPRYWNVLESCGASFVQGFGIEPPLTAPDFETWLGSRAAAAV